MVLLFPLTALAQDEKVDTAAMGKIRAEGLQHSQVMDIIFHLTDASGPRLTSSPGFFRAANYAKQSLATWGLSNAMLDPWGDFGKSWELEKSYVAITAPWYKSLNAYPKTWTAGTKGLQNAEVMLITAKDSAGLDAVRGKLAGKILILDRTDSYKLSFKPDAIRYTDVELDSMANIKMQPVDTAAQRRRREQNFNQNRAQQALVNTLVVKIAAKKTATKKQEHEREHFFLLTLRIFRYPTNAFTIILIDGYRKFKLCTAEAHDFNQVS